MLQIYDFFSGNIRFNNLATKKPIDAATVGATTILKNMPSVFVKCAQASEHTLKHIEMTYSITEELGVWNSGLGTGFT